MGSSSSIPKESPIILNEETTIKEVDNENSIEINDCLMKLPKEMLVKKIKEQQQIMVTHGYNNEIDGPGTIPRSIYTQLDHMSIEKETVKAKGIYISQLEQELRDLKKELASQRAQTRKKLAHYASELTDVRYKSNKQISELEDELKKLKTFRRNDSCDDNSNELTQPNELILQMSEKLSSQAKMIEEMKESLTRKDLIIEGFKLYEEHQCQHSGFMDSDNVSGHSYFQGDYTSLSVNKGSLDAGSVSDNCATAKTNVDAAGDYDDADGECNSESDANGKTADKKLSNQQRKMRKLTLSEAMCYDLKSETLNDDYLTSIEPMAKFYISSDSSYKNNNNNAINDNSTNISKGRQLRLPCSEEFKGYYRLPTTKIPDN